MLELEVEQYDYILGIKPSLLTGYFFRTDKRPEILSISTVRLSNQQFFRALELVRLRDFESLGNYLENIKDSEKLF